MPAIEITIHPQRVGLNDIHARRAHELGVLVAVETDADVRDQLENIQLGVATACRARIEKSETVKTLAVTKLLAWLERSRATATRGG